MRSIDKSINFFQLDIRNFFIIFQRIINRISNIYVYIIFNLLRKIVDSIFYIFYIFF